MNSKKRWDKTGTANLEFCLSKASLNKSLKGHDIPSCFFSVIFGRPNQKCAVIPLKLT